MYIWDAKYNRDNMGCYEITALITTHIKTCFLFADWNNSELEMLFFWKWNQTILLSFKKKLSKRFCHEWVDVSRTLGIEEATLSDIQNHTVPTHQKAYQMLNTWKCLKGEKATYKLLGEALIEAGRTDLYHMFIRKCK